MNRITLSVLAVLFLFLLPSCSSASLRNDSDVMNYIGETVTGSLDPESDEAAYAVRIIELISSDELEYPEFTDPRTAAKLCRDRILASMLVGSYTKYTGYSALLAEAEKKYPKIRISLVIPEEDFEYTVYTNFGGGKSVAHSSGTAFTYLSRIGGYTTVASVPTAACRIRITSAEETENTYVITFYSENDFLCSSLYTGVFVKRTDGTLYLGKLSRTADAKIKVPLG